MNKIENSGVFKDIAIRLIATFLILWIILLISSGCGTFPVKKEAAIAQDLVAGNHIFDGIKDIQIEDLEITRRKTDRSAKTDLVYVDVTASRADVMSLTGKYQIEYGLYDSGWFIDSIVVEEERILPLKGAAFEDEDIHDQVLLALSNVGYSNVSDLVCHDVFTDLPNSITTFHFSFTNDFTYVTMNIQGSLSFDFHEVVGWYTDYRTFQEQDIYQDWRIDGAYAITDGYAIFKHGHRRTTAGHIVIHDAHPADHIIIDFPDNFMQDYIANAGTSRLYHIGEDSFRDILRDALVAWSKPWHYVDAIEIYNYSIEIGGGFTSLSQFSYAIIVDRPDYILFIGKDELATCYEGQVHFDDGARRIVVEVHELEFVP